MLKKSLNSNYRGVRGKIWYIVFSLLVVIISAQLVVTNILASKGEELRRLEAKSEQLERENRALQEELAVKTSLVVISRSAENLGFVKSNNLLYLDLSNPVASLTQ